MKSPANMRIAVVSDIHGNLPALEAVSQDIQRRGVDLVVNLGDSLSGPLLPLETAQFLMQTPWVHIAGNHERQLLTHAAHERSASDAYAYDALTPKELDWLKSLAPNYRTSHESYFCHGTPTSDVHYFLETVHANGMVQPATASEVEDRMGQEKAQLILCGHTHIPRVVRSAAGQLIVNPGSVGLAAYDDIHPYPHVVETGSPDARYCIAEFDHASGWSVCQLTVAYKHQQMAQLAASRGRHDWEIALRTGYMS